jgi:hypothetical protein
MYYDRLLFDMTRDEFAARYPDVAAGSGASFRRPIVQAAAPCLEPAHA